jgi:hypothetical protein
MDTLAIIAAAPTIIVMLIGFASLSIGRGYSFDLRGKSRPLNNGRRASDPGERMELQTTSG